MKTYLLVVILSLSACAPLNPGNSALEDAGEIVGRALLCPITLCTSELMMYGEYQTKERYRERERWLYSLQPDQRAEQLRRDEAAMLALGMALSGGGPFQPRPVVAPTVIQPVPVAPVFTSAPRRQHCLTQQMGETVYLDCY